MSSVASRGWWMPETKAGKELADTMRLWFLHEDGVDEEAWQHWVSLIRAAEEEAVEA